MSLSNNNINYLLPLSLDGLASIEVDNFKLNTGAGVLESDANGDVIATYDVDLNSITSIGSQLQINGGINANNNSSIGNITNINYPLSVNSNSAYTRQLNIQGSNNASLSVNNPSGSMEIGVADGVSFSTDASKGDVIIRQTGTSKKMLIQSGTGSSAICISSSNQVGIGKATNFSGIARLEVLGGIASQSGDVTIFTNANTNNNGFRIRTFNQSTKTGIYGDNTTNNGFIMYTNDNRTISANNGDVSIGNLATNNLYKLLVGGNLCVNGLIYINGVQLNTDQILEGLTNLYWTNARFDARFATKTTDNLTEGTTNLYYTNSRARNAISIDNTNKNVSLAYDSNSGVLSANANLGSGLTTSANNIIVDSTVVRTTGNQSISGIKTFTDTSTSPIIIDNGTNASLRIARNNTTALECAVASAGGTWSLDASAGDAIIRGSNNRLLLQSAGGGASAICINNSNNIGINTANPGTKFDVNTEAWFRSPPLLYANTTTYNSGNVDLANRQNTYLSFHASVSSNDWAYLRQIGGSDSFHLGIDFHDNNDDCRFSLRNVTSTSNPDNIVTRFTVQNEKTGINTSNPLTSLDVRGDDSVAITVGNNSNARGALYLGNSNHGLLRDAFNNVQFYTAGFGSILNTINGTTHLIVHNSGNVGIGIGSGTPENGVKLDVNGEMMLRAFVENTIGERGIYFRSGISNPTTNKYNCSILTYDHNTDTNPDGLSINGFDGVSFCTGSNTRQERMRITHSGLVGIGRTNPNINSRVHIETDTANNIGIGVRITSSSTSGAQIVQETLNSQYTQSVSSLGYKIINTTALGPNNIFSINNDSTFSLYNGSSTQGIGLRFTDINTDDIDGRGGEIFYGPSSDRSLFIINNESINSNGIQFWTKDSSDLLDERIRITNDGKLSINKHSTNPGLLNIKGRVNNKIFFEIDDHNEQNRFRFIDFKDDKPCMLESESGGFGIACSGSGGPLNFWTTPDGGHTNLQKRMEIDTFGNISMLGKTTINNDVKITGNIDIDGLIDGVRFIPWNLLSLASLTSGTFSYKSTNFPKTSAKSKILIWVDGSWYRNGANGLLTCSIILRNSADTVTYASPVYQFFFNQGSVHMPFSFCRMIDKDINGYDIPTGFYFVRVVLSGTGVSVDNNDSLNVNVLELPG